MPRFVLPGDRQSNEQAPQIDPDRVAVFARPGQTGGANTGRDLTAGGMPVYGSLSPGPQYESGSDISRIGQVAGANRPANGEIAAPDGPGRADPSPPRREGTSESGLALIDRQVIQLFALVENAVAGATHALVSADREAARALVAADADIDDLYRELESLVHARLLVGPVSPEETQYLLAVLGMLPELERSGDLAEHVARRATRNLPAEMPARLRGYVQRMGEVACEMWRMAADAYGGDMPSASERLESLDDEMDDLHVTFIAELVTAGTPVVVAIELALVGRFYERLGDHAVNLARRVPSRLLPAVLEMETTSSAESLG